MGELFPEFWVVPTDPGVGRAEGEVERARRRQGKG